MLLNNSNYTSSSSISSTTNTDNISNNNLTQNEFDAQTLISTTTSSSSNPLLSTQHPHGTILTTTTNTTTNRSGAFEVPIWLILCYSVILLLHQQVGNLLVISTLTQNRRMRTITNVFLLNLAISDILLGVLCMPVTLVGTLLRNFIFGEYFCKLIQFSQAASVAVSSWTLVAISCERYYAICHPLRSRRWQTRSHAYKIIACIWCGSMLCMTPIALFSQLMPTSRPGYHKCRENWPSYALPYERPYNIFLDLILLVLPLVILSVAYILITRTLYVGMRIEKAMIFGGSCSGRLNCEEMYDDANQPSYQRQTGFSLGKATYLSTASSSTTTLTSATSTSSRFKFNLSLRRQGNNRNFSLHKGNTDKNLQEMNIFQQQQQQQQVPSQKLYHHQVHNPRLYQQQQQNHCHNYHQHHQLLLQNSDEQPEHQQQTLQQQQQQQQQTSFNKLCCDNFSRFCCGKRPTHSTSTTGNNGRRHLYCMRFATLKTLPDNESINGTNNFCTSDCCSSSNSCFIGSCSTNSGGIGNNGCLCNFNNKSPMAGNMPSSSNMNKTSASSAAAAAATSTTTYRYQMQQQQCNNPHHHHFTRNYYMQQVTTPELSGKSKGTKLFSSKRNLRSSDSVLRRNNIAKNLESKKRVVKMLSVLVLEFFICWTPLYVINTVAMYIGAAIYEYIDYKSISALQLLAYSSSCCNPITYCFMNANFRRAFLDTFKGMQWCSGKRFQRKRSMPQNKNLCLAGSSSIRVNSSTVQTIIDSPRL